MTLRALVVLLLLANALLWAWSHDALRGLGLAPAAAPVPVPLARQVRPEALTVRPLDAVVAQAPAPGNAAAAASEAQEEESGDETVPARAVRPDHGAADAVDATPPVLALPLPGFHGGGAEPDEQQDLALDGAAATSDRRVGPAGAGPLAAAPAADPASEAGGQAIAAPAACWQAGPFDAAQAQHLREAAAALPPGSWQLQQAGGQAPRWMIYLGGMEDELAMLAKRSELHARGLDVDRAGPGFELGLSLGRYSSHEAADRALQMLGSEAGVRGARVVQERTEEATYFLRAESAAPGWRDRLQALPLAGRSLRPCS